MIEFFYCYKPIITDLSEFVKLYGGRFDAGNKFVEINKI